MSLFETYPAEGLRPNSTIHPHRDHSSSAQSWEPVPKPQVSQELSKMTSRCWAGLWQVLILVATFAGIAARSIPKGFENGG